MDVEPFFVSTDALSERLFYQTKSAARVRFGGGNAGVVRRAIASFKPDLIHVHNLFPNLPTSWTVGIDIPIVATLHNFRYWCSNGYFFRTGHLCTRCLDHSRFNAVRYGCYRNSKVASAVVAGSPYSRGDDSAVLRAANRVIAQSQRVFDFCATRERLRDKTVLLPNFLSDTGRGASAPPAASFVFVGRDSPEKGLEPLLEIWPERFPLTIFGAERNFGISNVRSKGVNSAEAIRSELTNFSALIFPSLWWEGAYPRVVMEALEAGVPVIALEGNSASDLVDNFGIGSTFRDKPSLVHAIEKVLDSGFELRQLARETYERNFRVELWQAGISRIYSDLLDLKNG